MRVLLALLTLAPAALLAQERGIMTCATEARQEFHVSLFSAAHPAAPTHCVTGLPILDDLYKCAPDGGWGLTAFDGIPGPVRIATEPPVIHDGGWLFARVGPSEFVASASIGTRPPYTLEVAGETFWRMRMDLATGAGSIFTADGTVSFACE